MFQPGSLLTIVDNSFIKEVTLIKVLKSGKNPVGFPGDIAVAAIKSLRPQKAANLRTQRHLQSHKKKKIWSKGDIVRVLIVRSIKNFSVTAKVKKASRKNIGFFHSFPSSNAAIVLEGTSLNPAGSRIKGAISMAVKFNGFSKVVSLSKNVVLNIICICLLKIIFLIGTLFLRILLRVASQLLKVVLFM